LLHRRRMSRTHRKAAYSGHNSSGRRRMRSRRFERASLREGTDSVDETRFDDLTRALAGTASRRSLLRTLLGAGVASGLAAAGELSAAALAGARHKHKKKHCSADRKCEDFCCAKETFCCDPASKTCCAKGDACCNAGSGAGSCCTAPNTCADPYGDDQAPSECCPPDRSWTSDAGVSRCCPAGTRAMPDGGASTNGGPCCPTDSFCAGHCCADGASCIDNQCCAAAQVCNNTCCAPGRACCMNRCYLAPAVACGTACCENGDHCCDTPQGQSCWPPDYPCGR
jgi:hypothetical protein